MNCPAKCRGRAWCSHLLVVVTVALIYALTALSSPTQTATSLTGKLVVARNADGQLELFEVDAAGELRQRWQEKASGDWSSWASLGRGFLPGIAAVNAADGSLKLFAVDRANNALKCRMAPAFACGSPSK